MSETGLRMIEPGVPPTPKQLELWLGKKAYDEATTYHDGKWLVLEIDNKTALTDAEMLLAAKRKPKCASD